MRKWVIHSMLKQQAREPPRAPDVAWKRGCGHPVLVVTSENPNPSLKSSLLHGWATFRHCNAAIFVISLSLSMVWYPTLPSCTTLRFPCNWRAGKSFWRQRLTVHIPSISLFRHHLNVARGFLVQDMQPGVTITEACAIKSVESWMPYVEGRWALMRIRRPSPTKLGLTTMFKEQVRPPLVSYLILATLWRSFPYLSMLK
jgi:hypothetical protein